MLKKSRRSVAAPKILAASNAVAKAERDAAKAHYAGRPVKKSFAGFKVYKDQEVKGQLEALFHGKCAYCEARYRTTQPMDVEHFRPKAAVVVKGGTMIKPGYYWLAATWENLLPSCIDCNRKRTHEHSDKDPEVSGKANLFPILKDRRKSLRPNAEKREGGRRLLLDPCSDDPNAHLAVDEDNGFLLPLSNSAMGKASIDVYGLNREELTDERLAIIFRVNSQLDNIADLLAEIDDNGSSDRRLRMLSRGLLELKAFADEQSVFCGMVRQLLKGGAVFPELEEWIRINVGGRLRPKPRTVSWIDQLLQQFPPSRAARRLLRLRS